MPRPTRLFRHPATALLALGLSASPLAQQTLMEEIVVRGKYLSLDKVDSVKTPTPIIDVPQSLSILTEQQIQAQAFQNFGDVLRYTPGLSISQGEGHRDAIVIRGIESTADFFIDGMRDDVQYYRPLYNVSQVEVLRGANALLFGRGGGGGVINRVQKRPMVDERFATVTASVDSFGAHSTWLDGNSGLGDRTAFRLNGYYQHLENHRDAFDGESYAINPTMTVDVSDASTLMFSYEYVNDNRVVDRGVPSRQVAGGPNKPLEGFDEVFFGSPDENKTTLQAHLVRVRLDHDFSTRMRGNVTVQYADYDKAYQNLYASDAVTLIGGTFADVELDGYRDLTDRENLIVQANLVSEFDTGALHHTLLIGIEAGDQQTANARFDNVFAINGGDQLRIPFADPLDIPDFAFDRTSRNRQSDVRFTSVYAQDQIDLTSNLKLVAGLRYDTFDIEVVDFVERNDTDAIDGDFNRRDSEVTPRLGLIYKPAENISLYASYSETFLPRSGEQFLTLNLDAESTRPQFFENSEIGLKWDLNRDLSFTAALFELDRESYTSVDPADPARLIVVEGSRTRGAELQLSGNLTDNWTINAGYAYLDGEVERADGGGASGNVTAQTPRHMFSVWSGYRLSERLSIAFGATHQDRYFVREDNTVEVPGYLRIDAAAYWTVSERVRLQLNVENLLDEEYFPDAHSSNNISTGEPRNVRLSVVFDI